MITPEPQAHLTHVRADGSAHMVDVTDKAITTRTAVAEGYVITRLDVIEQIFDAALPKGDALPVARVAGIMGAKKTPKLSPSATPCPWAKLLWTFSG